MSAGTPQSAESDRRQGYNENGVAMCKCRRYGPAHVWEPGESCNPVRVVPDLRTRPGSEVDRG